MKYAVLIELSLKSISFRYYRDDAGNMFLPFNDNEGSIPLAICCQNNDVQMGQYAQTEAEKHSLYAWNNVFDAIKQNGTFPYRGQEKNMNELLLVAIKKYLSDFFDRILVKTNGTLEANISTLPLVFLFHPDIVRSDRLFIEKSFRDGGFVNLAALDMGCEVVGQLSQYKEIPAEKKIALTVFSDGADLIVNAIDTLKLTDVKSIRIIGKGIDPRLKYAVDKLWDSLDIYTYEMNKDVEYPILRDIAATFLASDDVVFQRPVMFSDGVERECYLDKNQIDGIDLGTDTKVRSDMLNFVSQLGFQENEVAIVLYGNIASSDYFIKNMRAVGIDVLIYKDPGLQKTLKYILDGIIQKRFKFNSNTAPVDEAPKSKPLASPLSINVNRKIREASHMTPQQAQIVLMRLENSLKKITPQPSDLQQYLDRISKTMDEVKANAKQVHKISEEHTKEGQDARSQKKNNRSGNQETHIELKESKTTAPLSQNEVKNANAVIMKARSESPKESVEHLKELLSHIQSLNPNNFQMWERRIKMELSLADQRLAKMPKPVKTSSNVKPQDHSKISTATPFSVTSKLVREAADGLRNISSKVKNNDLAKAQKLFTDTFRETFKKGKEESVKQLENLLETLHKMGVHKFDFQINSRIDLLKKK